VFSSYSVVDISIQIVWFVAHCSLYFTRFSYECKLGGFLVFSIRRWTSMHTTDGNKYPVPVGFVVVSLVIRSNAVNCVETRVLHDLLRVKGTGDVKLCIFTTVYVHLMTSVRAQRHACAVHAYG